jgi:hypothetical protein
MLYCVPPQVTDLAALTTDKAKFAAAMSCLQKKREELKSTACAEEVKRRTQRAARDIRFDDVLANACQEDRRQYCNDVQPVSGGGWRGAWVGVC